MPAEAPTLPATCLNAALFEAYYRGWDRAGQKKPCRPPALLSEGSKTAYVEGYRARLSPTLGPVPKSELKRDS